VGALEAPQDLPPHGGFALGQRFEAGGHAHQVVGRGGADLDVHASP
jgi:hypothetical protein